MEDIRKKIGKIRRKCHEEGIEGIEGRRKISKNREREEKKVEGSIETRIYTKNQRKTKISSLLEETC